MAIVLDPAVEDLLHRQLDRGVFADANELIAHALHLVASEQAVPTPSAMDDWLLRNKDGIRSALDESSRSRDRGEGYSPAQLKAHFAERRAARTRPTA